MKAFVIEAQGRTGTATLAEPEPGPGEVLLRVRTVGFCGSDLNTYRGLNPMVSYPRIPGHEIAATVERLGAGVPETIRPGMDVTVIPTTACGRCSACRRGRTNTCRDNQTLGVQRDGAMTDRLVVPWEKVVPAEGLSLRQLALVEPLSVGFHAAARARVEPGDVVGVIGCGAVGLGVVAGAAERGATVVALDIDDAKLALARRAGAAHVVNTAAGPPREALLALTGGQGPDVMVEAVGLPATFVSAVEEVAFAGRVVYIGWTKTPVTYDTALFVRKELDVLGSRNALAADFAGVVRMLARGTFPVAESVSREVPFEAAGEALRDWAADPAGVTRIHVALA